MSSGCYDVIVIGAGHAGAEASLAAARLGCKTLCLTLSMDNIALMPCNPSIGGPAKGHLVREIDALGGQMALSTDETLVQIRTLNTSKGPAVQTLRAQVDKKLYQASIRKAMEGQPDLDVKQAMATDVNFSNGTVTGVTTQTGIVYQAPAVVITTGVYMDARVVIGELAYSAGPNGQLASVGLSESLTRLGLDVGRFKTGTPPRVDGRSVDFSRMEPQYGDEEPLSFSFMSEPQKKAQLPCWLTYTNEETHEIIRANIDRAPLFNGTIQGTGPRYCPSIEDKVMRFRDKQRHQVFIEPEGWETREMYVLGISTSLPEDIQYDVLRTIPGLERVEIVRPGYAIEYDYVLPSQLRATMEYRDVPGLFAAGQVNGTSGYEEAAAQGLMAGMNAALKVKGQQSFVLDRSEAYIGVLIDDLITKGPAEPYRMLTSRAEYRLRLRHDNADFRLTEKGFQAGLATADRHERFLGRKELFEKGMQAVEATGLVQKLRRPEVSYAGLASSSDRLPELPADVAREIEVAVKFQGYLDRQDAEVARFKRLETRRIPEDLDYQKITGLSSEAREKLARLRPSSLGVASRIAGVSPSDVSVILVHLERYKGAAL